MATMFEWINYNRPDVETLKGPDDNGNCHWDLSLPNQEQIIELIGQYSPLWTLPPPVPQSVTTRQIRQALIQMSYLTGNQALHPKSITDFINSMPEGMQKDIAYENWEYSNEFFRNNPLLLSMAPALGLASEQIDDLFRLASTL